VKELWEQAILPYNLPLTIALGAVVVFWLFSLIGAVGVDTLDLDLDVPEDVGADGHLGDLPGAMLRLVNAGHVPLTVVLSLLILAVWLISIFANYLFNPNHSLLTAGGLFVAALVLGVVVTKILTQPLIPLMRRLKEAEDAKPVIGEVGVVRSIELSDACGQVEVNRGDGAPAILNARLSSGSNPLPRGTAVVVLSIDEKTGIYLAKEMPPIAPETSI
jgi:hypothetical protein